MAILAMASGPVGIVEEAAGKAVDAALAGGGVPVAIGMLIAIIGLAAAWVFRKEANEIRKEAAAQAAASHEKHIALYEERMTDLRQLVSTIERNTLALQSTDSSRRDIVENITDMMAIANKIATDVAAQRDRSKDVGERVEKAIAETTKTLKDIEITISRRTAA